MILPKRILWTLLFLAIAVPVRAAGDLAVLYPPDLTLTTEDKIRIFAFQPGGGGATYVKVNGKPEAKLEGENFRKGEVALPQGITILEIGGKQVRVFRMSGVKMNEFRLSMSDGSAPLDFRAFAVHPALDDGCEGCHTVEGGKLAAKEQKAACYACHTDFGAEEPGKKKYVHTPVAAGECTGCHDPHMSFRPKLQKLEKGCFECHDPFPASGVVHRPVAEGKCGACHSPHAGPAPKQLLVPGNALCIACHEAPHAQHLTAAVKGKMTQVPDDFPRDNEQLSCLGCHMPHQSEERRLFRKNQGALCRTCHPV